MQRPGSAILVDGDNVPPEVLAPLLAHLEQEGPVTERKIFRNWRSSRNAQAWDMASQMLAFERVDRYRTSSGKNASDIALVVTAMDLFHTGTRRFCIASGDTDFAPLVERLRRGGARVTLIGHKGKASAGLLTDIADEYLDFPQLVRGHGRRAPAKMPPSPTPKPVPPPGRAKRTRKAAAPPPPPPPPPPKPRTSRSRPGGRPPRGAEPPADLSRLRDLFLDSYEVARTDGEVDAQGWVAVDRLGQIARSVDPDFSPAKYGLGARTSLTKAFSRLDAFEVQAVGRSGNRQYRVRLRNR